MKKNLLVLAVMGIMCFANVTTAHAEFIVQPTAEEADGTSAGYKWYMEEQQRWIDRLIDNNADRIRQIARLTAEICGHRESYMKSLEGLSRMVHGGIY